MIGHQWVSQLAAANDGMTATTRFLVQSKKQVNIQHHIRYLTLIREITDSSDSLSVAQRVCLNPN